MLEKIVDNFAENFIESLFDSMAGVVYCVKDRQGRYQTVNQAFVERLDVDTKSDVVGKKANDFFPSDLASVYDSQDDYVFSKGLPIQDQLERITNRDGSMGDPSEYAPMPAPLHSANPFQRLKDAILQEDYRAGPDGSHFETCLWGRSPWLMS